MVKRGKRKPFWEETGRLVAYATTPTQEPAGKRSSRIDIKGIHQCFS